MQIRRISTTLLVLLSILSLKAQTTIKGHVIDEEKEPVSYAGVILMQEKDSTVLATGYTDLSGMFSLNLPNQIQDISTQLNISHLGYEAYKKTLQHDEHFVKVNLVPSTTNLSELQVFAKRIQKTPMGYSINLANDIRTKSINVAKTLTLLPGISNVSGVFKLNGIPVSRFYVNGQKVNPEDLKSIPSDMLAKAEISFIDNIGASKSGSAISLTLKNPTEGGYYGSANTGLSFRGKHYDTFSISSILNGKFKKMNVLANIRYSNTRDNTKQSDDIQYNNGRFIDILSTNSGRGNGLSPKLSLLYEISDTQSLGFNVSGNFKSLDKNKIMDNSFLDTNNNFSDYEKGSLKTNTVQGVISYIRRTNEQGGLFKLQAEYLRRDKKDKSIYLAEMGNSERSMSQQTLSDIWNVFTQLTYPISDNISGNTYLVWDGLRDKYNSTSTASASELWGNDVSNTEVFIHNPYIMTDILGKWNKFNFIARFSYQGSFLTYRSLELSKDIKRKAQGIEPNIRLSYNFGKNNIHSLSAEYKRSVGTFPYSLLNPNKVWQDRYHYIIGNSEILAPTKHSALLNGSFWSDKLYVWIGYEKLNNRYVFATYKDENLPDVTYLKPINGASEYGWDFGVESNLSVTNNWKMKIKGNWNFSDQTANLPTGIIHVKKTHSLYDFTNIWQFGKGWNIYMTAYYEPSYKSYNRKYFAVYGVDGSVSKSIKKDITLYFDFGIGQHRKLFTYLEDGIQIYKNRTPLPYLAFTFQWRFKGGEQVKVKQTRTSKRYYEIKDK